MFTTQKLRNYHETYCHSNPVKVTLNIGTDIKQSFNSQDNFFGKPPFASWVAARQVILDIAGDIQWGFNIRHKLLTKDVKVNPS